MLSVFWLVGKVRYRAVFFRRMTGELSVKHLTVFLNYSTIRPVLEAMLFVVKFRN